MNHDAATALFDGLGETVDSRPPMSDLLAAGRTGERRKRRRAVAGAVLSVALVLGGGVAVGQLAGVDDSKPKRSEVAEPPAPPAGMRLVGYKRVGVAVPDSWGQQDTRCGQPVASTVYVIESAARACLVTPSVPIATLQLVDRNSDEGRAYATSLNATSVRNGVEVVEGELLCGDTAQCLAPLPYVVDVPDQGVVLVLRGPAAEQPLRDRILDTLLLLPDDVVAVPRIEPGTFKSKAVEQLAAAGLTTGRLTLENSRIFGTDPDAATVVPAGSEVRLLTEPQTEETETDPGRRLFGIGRVVFAVPGDWEESRDEEGCFDLGDGSPVLYVREPDIPDDPACGTVKFVVAFPLDSPNGRAFSHLANDAMVVEGATVEVPETSASVGDACAPNAACIYGGQVVVVPEADVVLLVSGGDPADEALVGEIVSSLRLTPDYGGDVLGSIGNETLRVGETADLTLYVHCGLEFNRVDGTWWQTERRGKNGAPPGFDDPFTEVRATRVSDSVVEVTHRDEVIVFHPKPAEAEVPGCF